MTETNPANEHPPEKKKDGDEEEGMNTEAGGGDASNPSPDNSEEKVSSLEDEVSPAASSVVTEEGQVVTPEAEEEKKKEDEKEHEACVDQLQSETDAIANGEGKEDETFKDSVVSKTRLDPQISSTVRRILHKFASDVSPTILSHGGASDGSFFTNLFGLSSTSGTKQIRTRQCTQSLERLSRALVHVEQSHTITDVETKEWDDKHCSKLIGLFVDVLCTWTGLNVVSGGSVSGNGDDGSDLDASNIYAHGYHGNGEDQQLFELDMMHEMGVEAFHLAKCINCAQELVAYGCLDHIDIGIRVKEIVQQNRSPNLKERLPKPPLKVNGTNNETSTSKGTSNSLLQQTSETLNAEVNDDETIESETNTPEDSVIEPKVKFITINMLAVDRIADAIFSADLSSEEVELSALKYLLTAASRTVAHDIVEVDAPTDSKPHGNALLRGNRLLRALRVLYHVFLRTSSGPNRTTARAALEQIVNSVFQRMETESGPYLGVEEAQFQDGGLSAKSQTSNLNDTSFEKSFPSLNHRDAFIVLRSLCKLAMKGHTPRVDVKADEQEDPEGIKDGDIRIYASESRDNGDSYSPAMRSKILSLELLLTVLDDPGKELTSCHFFAYAVRQYLCVTLLKNFTSNVTRVVGLSLRLFVPIIRYFREGLKAEVEAFITNVFFVILDSPNSDIDHKNLVVTLFKEICSDPATLSEIFLNYDCDLSAVDLFHRIVSSIARVAKGALTFDEEETANSHLVVSGTGIEKLASIRQSQRSLKLNATKALRQVLASLYSCTVPFVLNAQTQIAKESNGAIEDTTGSTLSPSQICGAGGDGNTKPNLVEIYDSKKRLKESLDEFVLRFNQKPSAGIKYAGQINLIQVDDPISVANFLLEHKERLSKTQIGELLGREADYQNGFYIRVLQAYVTTFSFHDLTLDEAIRLFLSGFRLPGEAQKIDRIMEKFAERYCTQNPKLFPTADAAFILSFSIIMLNTDLHNPAIKPERRMTKEGFIRNNRGICNGNDLPSEMLTSIFDRIKKSQISLKEDDEAREREKGGNGISKSSLVSTPGVLLGSHFDEMTRKRASKFLKESNKMLQDTERLLKVKNRNRMSKIIGTNKFVTTEETGLRDEYVSPMFEVTWGAALAAFSTSLESSNGSTNSTQWAEATENERYAMSRHALAMTEVCVSGFRFAICVAGACGHEIARNSFVNALANFSQLGTSVELLEHRHIRCIQALLRIARDDGEYLGSSWRTVFSVMSEVARLQRLLDKLARVKIQNRRGQERVNEDSSDEEDSESFASDFMGVHEMDDISLDDDLDRRTIEEMNAKTVQEAIPSEMIDTIYLRSTRLSDLSIKEFIDELCNVSRSELSGHGQSHSNGKRIHSVQNTASLLRMNHHQPVIYSLQRLVEVAHYNMDSRLLCVWGEIWTTVSSLLVDTALHPSNEAVAIYAVDSLRQLSIQYLQRKELGIFEFQRRFLKPYEIIMMQCNFATPRELLLKGIEQILLRCGGGGTDSVDVKGSNPNTLRSGWRTILSVLGLAARDSEDSIAKMGFHMLNNLLDELKKDVAKACLSLGIIGRVNTKNPSPVYNEYSHCHGYLMAEHFVDLVESLAKYISGRRTALSKKALAYLVMMTDWLGNDQNPKPCLAGSSKLRSLSSDVIKSETASPEESNIKPAKSSELELWWPVLLCFSHSVADNREVIRSNALSILMKVINRDFLRIPNIKVDDDTATPPRVVVGNESDLITLQLIFRGILHPILEYADQVGYETKTLTYLPKNFTYLISPQPSPSRQQKVEPGNKSNGSHWADETFYNYIDGCIALCNRASDYFHNMVMMEELVSIFNACLQSDSAIIRLRGLQRLELILTDESQTPGKLSDKIIQMICEILSRNLMIPLNYENDENVASIAGQRLTGSYVVHVTSMLLLDKAQNAKPTLLQRVQLANSLSTYITNWENVAKLPEFTEEDQHFTVFTPPHPLENAMFGRKLLVQFITLLTFKDGYFNDLQDSSLAQELVVNVTQTVIECFLEKETAMIDEPRDPVSEACYIVELGYMTSIVCDLLDGYTKMDDASFSTLIWLRPILSSLIESNTKSIRTSVQTLVTRSFDTLSGDEKVSSRFRPQNSSDQSLTQTAT